jgi:helix-turn-helix protein
LPAIRRVLSCSFSVPFVRTAIVMAELRDNFDEFPLLQALLREKKLSLRGTYTNRDVAEMFGVAVRTIQEWCRNGKLHARKLPGRARFLSCDLEEFLQGSSTMSRPASSNGGVQTHYISQNKSPRRFSAG